jgi:hypothetical protein
MPEAIARKVRWVMYDANEWLHAMREVPRADRSVWMGICNLQIINEGPIPYNPDVIARHLDEDGRRVRASILRLISRGHVEERKEGKKGDLSSFLSSRLADIALSASANRMKNNKTADIRARETPSESINKKINAREERVASPRKGGSAPPLAEQEKVVPIRASTPSKAQARREAETAARREAEARREAQAEAERQARWAATVRDRKSKRRLKRLEQQAIFLRYNHPELLAGYWEATQFGPGAEPFDRQAWKTAVRKTAMLVRHAASASVRARRSL